jgi:putative copper export protein
MSSFEVALSLVVAAVVVFQIWLTRRVFRSAMFERKQKIWQAQLIWLLPIVGAILVFGVLQEEQTPRGPSSHLKG